MPYVNPAPDYSAGLAPSPWGEGWGEGEQMQLDPNLPACKFKFVAKYMQTN
ncbi:Uncharacterised protein [Serratia fonticola]|nr:Uncharacterised protein [Serratia fonticola]